MSVSASPTPVSSSKQQASRIISLDVYRGLTVAGMILVTDPGTYDAVYGPLRHAAWMGATATDMIFPSFLFVVGVSIVLSFTSRIERGADRRRLAWHVLRRSAMLFLVGLAVNGFADYHWSTLRLPGILQRIAVCYLCGGLLYLLVSQRKSEGETSAPERAILPMIGVALGILITYAGMLKWVAIPGVGAGRLDSFGNLPAYIDRMLLGTRHMWAWGLTPGLGVTYDPEGILSTVPAVSATLFGIAAGEWMRTERSGKQKALALLLASLVLTSAGWLLSPLLPMNKRIWTSTFALFSGGISLILFAALYTVVDLWRSRWWTPPVMVLGTNAILAFVISGVITTLSDRLHVPGGSAHPTSLHHWAYQHVFAGWLAPVNASLAYALAITALNIVLILPLYQKRIFLRI